MELKVVFLSTQVCALVIMKTKNVYTNINFVLQKNTMLPSHILNYEL